MSYYTHLSINELTFIESYHEQGHSGRSIARRLERSPETVSRVIRKMQSGLGAPQIYAKNKENKKRCGRRKIELSRLDKAYIESKVKLGWTPDVIIGRGERSLPCGATTLYRRFREGIFDIRSLPMQGKKKPNGYKEKRGKQPFTRDLRSRETEHPNYDTEFGHLEGDTIIGKASQSAIITLAERQSKSIIALKTEGRTALDTEVTLSNWLDGLPKHFFKSITFDCGKEFSNWKNLSNRHDIDIYFADPGTPSQRGLNENSNGLLRRGGLPKKIDFNKVSKEYVASVTDRRNNIPRKSLNYKTPIECMAEYTRQLELSRLLPLHATVGNCFVPEEGADTFGFMLQVTHEGMNFMLYVFSGAWQIA